MPKRRMENPPLAVGNRHQDWFVAATPFLFGRSVSGSEDVKVFTRPAKLLVKFVLGM